MNKVLLSFVLTSALSVGVLGADTIVLRTGVDASNAVLAAGDLDPAWLISTNGSTFDSAKVLYPVQVCCGMETAGTTAAWISDPSITAGLPNTAWGVDNTVYIRRTFDVSGLALSSLALSGTWRLADWTMGAYLNGNLIPGTNIGNGGADQSIGTWFSDHSLTAGSALFVSGINTLEFRGQSVNSGWDGLWFDGTVTGDPVPEPSSLLLLTGGLLALRRRAAARR
jgi:hypothetical protein